MNKFLKALYKMRFIPLLIVPLLIAMMVLPATLMAYGPTVDLLTTSNFAILAATTITNTGATTINGDVGLHPGTAFVNTGVTLNGTAYLTDAVALQAKNDLVTVYNAAAGRTPATDTFSGDNPLGGKTLTSGVYVLGEATTELSGTLTLDAQGDENAVFIFQVPSDLVTASGSVVSLINGARFCRVFWVVPSSATLGEGSTFVGHIFALTSITVNSGVTVYGQLLAREGAVTLINDTITNGPCPTVSGPSPTVSGPSISLTKTASLTSITQGVASTITYTYTVTNTGTGNLTNLNVTDNQLGAISLSSTTLAAGASITGTISTTLTPANTSSIVNTAIATGTPPTGPNVTANATATVTVTAPTETTAAPTETTAAPVTTTVTGGQIPKTSTPWYNVLLVGIVLILIGSVGWIIARKINGKSKT